MTKPPVGQGGRRSRRVGRGGGCPSQPERRSRGEVAAARCDKKNHAGCGIDGGDGVSRGRRLWPAMWAAAAAWPMSRKPRAMWWTDDVEQLRREPQPTRQKERDDLVVAVCEPGRTGSHVSVTTREKWSCPSPKPASQFADAVFQPRCLGLGGPQDGQREGACPVRRVAGSGVGAGWGGDVRAEAFAGGGRRRVGWSLCRPRRSSSSVSGNADQHPLQAGLRLE